MPDPTAAELDKWEAQMGEHIGHPVPRLIKALRACRKQYEDAARGRSEFRQALRECRLEAKAKDAEIEYPMVLDKVVGDAE